MCCVKKYPVVYNIFMQTMIFTEANLKVGFIGYRLKIFTSFFARLHFKLLYINAEHCCSGEVSISYWRSDSEGLCQPYPEQSPSSRLGKEVCVGWETDQETWFQVSGVEECFLW